MGKRYKDRQELKAAVREKCLSEWRTITTSKTWPNGVEWDDRFADDFQDRPYRNDLEREGKISADLHAALKAALEFYEEHASASVVTHGSFTHWILPKLLSPDVFASAPEYVRLSDGCVAVDWQQLKLLEQHAESFRKGKKGLGVSARVVSLLTDSLQYWRRFGLESPADSRTMAIVALLVGEFPRDATIEHAQGPTVAEVIEAEQKAINTAWKRHKERVAVWILCMLVERFLKPRGPTPTQ